jgi:hypothetical protein
MGPIGSRYANMKELRYDAADGYGTWPLPLIPVAALLS